MKILCIGDSHTRLIGAEPIYAKFRYGRVCHTHIYGFEQAHVLSIKGATAAGFRPKEERSSSFGAAARAIKRLDPQIVCFGFGQVDAEQSCYFKAFRDGIDIQEAVKAKQSALLSYLRFCKRLAQGRRIIIKGLNTTTLHETRDLRKMLLRNLPSALGMPKKKVARWLESNDVTVSTHRNINVAVAESLQNSADLLTLPYFDIRYLTDLQDQPGLTKPEFCARVGDVHLSQTSEIEASFANEVGKIIGETETPFETEANNKYPSTGI